MSLSRIPLVALALAVALLAFLGVRHATKDATSLEAESWTLTNVEGNDVVINVLHGACDEFERIEVVETPAQVAVGVIHRVFGGSCILVGLTGCHRITLQAPLGSRALAYAGPLPYLNEANELTPPELPGARAGQPRPYAFNKDC